MRTPIVGVSGNAGVGKDTLAEYLVQKYGFVRIGLADPMKRIAKLIYDFTDEQLWGPSQKRNEVDLRYPRDPSIVNYKFPEPFLSPRVALQVLGTEFGRTCYLNTWVDMVLRDAKAVLEDGCRYLKESGISDGDYCSWKGCHTCGGVPPRGVVIPDCRFQNEVDAVHNAGGAVIRLRRDTGRDAATVGAQNHISELEQRSIPDSEFDLVIDAANGVEAFHTQLDGLIPALLAEQP